MPPKKKLAARASSPSSRRGCGWARPIRARRHRRRGEGEGSAIDWNKAREWWSFRPLAAPKPPAVQNTKWPANDVDRFILAKLEAAKLKPAADADKRALIRRATYDLIGLPPTPEEVAAFVADASPDAFARVVDRLLASPRYGERWGRHWLDVVRYADTAGDNSDYPIPQMHRYRDWVIAAFNRDLPYDQFVREQLAGDLRGGATEEERYERIIATGYIANARRFGSRVDDYPQHLTIEDTIDNLGPQPSSASRSAARAATTTSSIPSPQQDYYALYGIFHSTRYPWPGIELDKKQRDFVPLVPTEKLAEAEATQREREKERARLDSEVAKLKNAVKEGKGEKKEAAAGEAEGSRAGAREGAEKIAALRDGVRRRRRRENFRCAGPAEGRSGQARRRWCRRHFLTVLGGAELPPGDEVQRPRAARRLDSRPTTIRSPRA